MSETQEMVNLLMHHTINQRATATDFTVTFTDGTTGNLFATLNAGNSVILDFFYTT